VQVRTLLCEMPRFPNGAISHQRTGRPEYWSDSVAMAPPFLAAYGVTMGEETCLQEAVRQCRLYHGALVVDSSYGKGAWKHILSDPDGRSDSGCWSTGNAWAAWGMTRVLAGLRSWHRRLSISSGIESLVDENCWLHDATLDLEDWIQAILDMAQKATVRESLLVTGASTDPSDRSIHRTFSHRTTWTAICHRERALVRCFLRQLLFV
jgi:rhamnogalacturonyl hydrolase YesR